MNEKTLRVNLARSYKVYYRDQLRLPDWSDRVDRRLQLTYETAVAERLASLVDDLSSKLILDIGCGWGGTMVAISRIYPNAKVYGLEPERDRVGLASASMNQLNTNSLALAAMGEKIPLPDHSVDIVCAYQVLEHVNDPREVVREILRVLRPGGYFHTLLPNYCTFFEPHYKVFWIPFAPKWLAKIYLRFINRPPEFLSAFHYTTPWQIRRLFDPITCAYRDLVQEDLEARLRNTPQSNSDKPMRSRKIRILEYLPYWLAKPILIAYRYLVVRQQEYLVRKHPSLEEAGT